MQGLQDKVALITAGAGGIGYATARRLAHEGVQVWVTDMRQEALQDMATHFDDTGLSVHTLEADSTSEASIQLAVNTIKERHGRIDILVNNAGGSLHTPYAFEDESDTDWARVMDLNMMGAVWACRAVLPMMRQQQAGRVINFGSKAGKYASLIAGANYAAAKGAIAAFTRQLAMEYGPDGITVNCVCPGVVLTERTQRLWNERRTAAERARVLEAIPLRRHATADDVASVVAFLASDDAAFVTGVSLDVNGGQSMGG